MQSIVDGNHIFYEYPNIGVTKESPRSAFSNAAKADDFLGFTILICHRLQKNNVMPLIIQ